MRAKRVKQIRRGIYGLDMPTSHVYMETNKRLRKIIDKDTKKEIMERYITSTRILTSLRRAYKEAKKKFKSTKKSIDFISKI